MNLATWDIESQIGNHFDGTYFTAPVNGFYYFKAQIFFNNGNPMEISMKDSQS